MATSVAGRAEESFLGSASSPRRHDQEFTRARLMDQDLCWISNRGRLGWRRFYCDQPAGGRIVYFSPGLSRSPNANVPLLRHLIEQVPPVGEDFTGTEATVTVMSDE